MIQVYLGAMRYDEEKGVLQGNGSVADYHNFTGEGVGPYLVLKLDGSWIRSEGDENDTGIFMQHPPSYNYEQRWKIFA